MTNLDLASLDLVAHLQRQIAFSRATFGPGERTAGVSDHIRKELEEIANAGSSHRYEEWVDVVILALDGLWRSLAARGEAYEQIPEIMAIQIVDKQTINELRDWPNWRTASEDQAIEHVR